MFTSACMSLCISQDCHFSCKVKTYPGSMHRKEIEAQTHMAGPAGTASFHNVRDNLRRIVHHASIMMSAAVSELLAGLGRHDLAPKRQAAHLEESIGEGRAAGGIGGCRQKHRQQTQPFCSQPLHCTCLFCIAPHPELVKAPCTMRFGSTAKVLLKCKLKYYRISEVPCKASVHEIVFCR